MHLQDLSTKKVVAVALKQGGLYKLDLSAKAKTKCNMSDIPQSKPIVVYSSKFMDVPNFFFSSTNNAACNSSSIDILHARLGQTSSSKMKHIAECNSHISDNFFCEICVLAKSHKLPFNNSSITTQSLF